MSNPLDLLVQEKVLKPEAVARLRKAWVADCDELYGRVRACEFSNDPQMIRAMEQELGLDPGRLAGFSTYIAPYVTPELVEAGEPPRHPLGALIPPNIPCKDQSEQP